MLFLQELKKIIFSVSYIIFAALITAALFSQGALDFHDDKIEKPRAGGNYGTAYEEIPEIIMPAACRQLWDEFLENDYRTYPVGFIKHVKLNDSEQAAIADILSEITGCSITSAENARPLTVRGDITYSDFKALMQQADDILGGGSDYHAENLIQFGTVPISYEEAVRRYETAISRDKITGGYARLFSDYAAAMVMSVLPVFLAVITCMKDRRAKMTEIIYTRKISAAKIIAARYAAVITAAMLPVFILSYISNISVWGLYPGMQLDYSAPLKYDLGWILPSVMIAAATGMCLTELTNTAVAAAIQGFWWLSDTNAGMRSVSAGYSLFRLAPRHNAGTLSCFRTQDYLENFNRLAANRLLFAGLSVLLILITTAVYEKKRKGKLNGNYKIRQSVFAFRNRQNQPEA